MQPVETVKQQTQGRRGHLERQDRLEAVVLQAARGQRAVQGILGQVARLAHLATQAVLELLVQLG